MYMCVCVCVVCVLCVVCDFHFIRFSQNELKQQDEITYVQVEHHLINSRLSLNINECEGVIAEFSNNYHSECVKIPLQSQKTLSIFCM
jgi:hypothetical protein